MKRGIHAGREAVKLLLQFLTECLQFYIGLLLKFGFFFLGYQLVQFAGFFPDIATQQSEFFIL